MDFETLGKMVQNLIHGLPDKVRDLLDEVEFLVFETASEASNFLKAETIDAAKEDNETPSQEELAEFNIPDDAKGAFIGDPAEHDDTAEEGDADDLKYEPEGYIVLIASQIESPDAAVLVFLHELGHALGMDEREVAELGLAVAEGAKQAALKGPNASETTSSG